MKIHKTCFFTWDDPSFVSGCRTWLERLLPELVQYGIQPSVIYLPSADGQQHSHVQSLLAAGIPCYPLPSIYPWTTETAIAALKGVLRTIRPDSFVPNFWSPGYYAAAELRDVGIEPVGVLHSDDPYYWDIVDKTVCRPLPRQRITHWAAVSQFLATKLMHRTPAGEDLRIASIPAGVHTSSLAAQFPETGPFRIGYFGRIVTEQKRILDVAAAMQEVSLAFENVSCEIYGKGDQEAELTQWLIDNPGNGSVRYCGGLSHEQSIAVMAQMHVVLLLSDYEGLSVALMEAMSVGVPVLSYACQSGTDELIRHGVNGFIVTERRQQVVSAIGSVVADSHRWNRMSKAAKDTIRGRFSVQHGASDWARLLRHAESCPHGRWRAVLSRLTPWTSKPFSFQS